MTAYLIVNYDIDDADAYGAYQKGAAPALGIGDGTKILAVGPNSTHVEGEATGNNTVVLEFASREEAEAKYNSEAYQAVLPQRLGATSKHFAVIVDAFG